MAVNINLLEISFNADDRILAYDAPYDRLRSWSEGGKSGRMFIYFVGPILASYVRSVWQKDDVLCNKFSSTEDVLAQMRTIRCIVTRKDEDQHPVYRLSGSLKRKHEHGKVLSQGNYASVIENGQIILPKRPEWDIKTYI